MKTQFQLKLIQLLNQKKQKNNEGFTLIELLVVVIIVGVLAAVALPNLLGQVGKAREVEGKDGVGAINRAQESYHQEAQTFVTASIPQADLNSVKNPLGIAYKSKYYDFTTSAGTAAGVTVAADAKNATKDGVRNYGGAVVFDTANGVFDRAVCQGASVATAVTPDAGTVDDAKCAATDVELK